MVTSCFAILGKKGKCLKAARMFSFEVKRNRKTPNDVKLNSLQNGYLGFLIFSYFDPKNSRFRFFKKIIAYKMQNFQDVLKIQSICYQDTCKQQVCNISKQYLYFWLCNDKTTSNGDDVTYLKRNFWHL